MAARNLLTRGSPRNATTKGNRMKTKRSKRAMCAVLMIGMSLTGSTALAQENRKAISSPTPAYPDTAKRFRLTGVVKVQVVIAPNGQIKEVKVVGGHPLLVNAVEETLKNWKYAPASGETTAQLEFNFHP
jgi:TonB family protein